MPVFCTKNYHIIAFIIIFKHIPYTSFLQNWANWKWKQDGDITKTGKSTNPDTGSDPTNPKA